MVICYGGKLHKETRKTAFRILNMMCIISLGFSVNEKTSRKILIVSLIPLKLKLSLYTQ
jgi:hypothetical protein